MSNIDTRNKLLEHTVSPEADVELTEEDLLKALNTKAYYATESRMYKDQYVVDLTYDNENISLSELEISILEQEYISKAIEESLKQINVKKRKKQ